MLLLGCRSISKTYGPRMLFANISLAFEEGERVGLIGANGSGKTTLLKILSGVEKPDSGEIISKRNLRLAYLPQEDSFQPNLTAEQVLVAAQTDPHLEDHQKLAAARIMLGKMGFDSPERRPEDMSGGWRKRLALARELITQPELLLLDEPTNHLDLEGILWLENLLKTAPFAFALVSHDRYFLENTTNRTIELSAAFPEGSFSINGTYSDFLEKREEFLTAQASQQVAIASRVKREIEWLKRGAKARTTKAKGRIQAAGQMMTELAELKTRNAASRTIAIDFAATDRKSRKLVVAKGISKSIGGRTLFKDLDLILSPGMKVGLLGPNGSGKTTLIRTISAETQPDAGTIRHAEGLRIVRFEQDRSPVDRQRTLRQALSPKSDTVVYRGRSMHITAWARQFLFRTEQLDLPVGQLSGGEQARVLIAQLMLRPADILLLDEPTNDLDIPTIEVLEDSLEDFPGAVVLVTHDRFMLDRLCTDILGLDGKGSANLYADLSQWQTAQETARAAEEEAKKPATKAAPAAAPKEKPKRLTYMEQREWEQMEGKIMAAEADVERLHHEMEDPAVLADRQRLAECCEKMTEAQDLVRKLYARWEELEAKQQP